MRKILWLTLADPEPANNGQFLYSSGLIRAVAAADGQIDLHVLGLNRQDQVAGRKMPFGANVTWHLTEDAPRSKWASRLGLWPQVAMRSKTKAMEKALDLLLREQWDAIVFDSISVGWALHTIGRQQRARTKLVYLAHNFEAGIATLLARDESNPLRRTAKMVDAWKVEWLERAICRHAALVTANTPEDAQRFRKIGAWNRVEFVPPGYSGYRLGARRITQATPRRALIVGSFDWIAKQRDLERFLAVADAPFAAAGIELLVVGRADPSYLAALQVTLNATRLIGPVMDIAPYFNDARLALLIDRFGGFKLKTLDYIFNRMPMLGITGGVPGVPLEHNNGILLYPDHRSLTAGVVRSIDDLERLNELQDEAWRASDRRFDWPAIGAGLWTAISEAMATKTARDVRRSWRASSTARRPRETENY
jgi:polysaccharide biosynthesis protein PslH